MNKRRRVFLDHASATPIDKGVAREMVRAHTYFANPGALYDEAIVAHQELERARSVVASCIGAHRDEIVFTASASESISLAHRGLWESGYIRSGDEVIATPIEHDAVAAQLQWLRNQGVIVRELPVDAYGMINPEAVEKLLSDRTKLVSCIYGHNEIGTIEPIAEIGKRVLAHRKQGGHALFHVDACQVMCAHVPVTVEQLHADLMSFNGSKIYGPRGIAVLYRRRAVPLVGIITGGGHEGGLRAGTENLQAVCGIAYALAKAREMSERQDERLAYLSAQLIAGIVDGERVVLLGHPTRRLSHHVAFAVRDMDGEELVIRLNARGVACSTKSACSTRQESASRTVQALKLPPQYERGVVRMVLGRGTTTNDIRFTIDAFRDVYRLMNKQQ